MESTAPEVDGSPRQSRLRIGVVLWLILFGLAAGAILGSVAFWWMLGEPLRRQTHLLGQEQAELRATIQAMEDAADIQAQSLALQAAELLRMEAALAQAGSAREKIEQDLTTLRQERDRLLERLLAPPEPEEPTPPPVAFENTVGVRFRLVPAGRFSMGDERDGPRHDVALTQPFYLGVTEVTRGQWENVMGALGVRGNAKEPVTKVSWDQALEFCRRLNALPAERQAGRTYRLPTEAEWEYACRAGANTDYGFGDDPRDLAKHGWFADNTAESPHEVGQLQPNAWGFYDMHGNVGEWCLDWFAEYPGRDPIRDPGGPAVGHRRIWRGGGYFSPAADCTAARRGRLEPNDPYECVGIRLAMNLPGQGGPPDELTVINGGAQPPQGFANLHNSIGIELKRVPAGKFMMGAKDVPPDESDGFPVTITRPFYLGVFEITNDQWARVMGRPGPGKDQLPDLPVTGITWAEAMDFCKRLSALPVETRFGRQYRLPTEAEWEYVCRSGTKTRFAFGDNPQLLNDYGWYQKNAAGGPHPVGYKNPNDWGFYDMHGNAAEWCQDFWAALPKNTKNRDDPKGPPNGRSRINRGGSWADNNQHCESTHRQGHPANASLDGVLGFRIALELD